MKIEIHKTDARGNVFRLLEDIRYNKRLVIPAGFESDGASVPRVFWGLVFPPLDNRALYAAIVHDYVYRTHPEGWTRSYADRTFFRLLRAGGVPWLRAKLAYCAVRLFGGMSWRKK